MCSPGVTSFRLSQHLPPMIQKSGKCLQSWMVSWGWRRGCVFQGSQVAPLEAAKGMHVGICHTPEFRLWLCQTLSLWLWAGRSLSEPCSSSLFLSEQGTCSDCPHKTLFPYLSPPPWDMEVPSCPDHSAPGSLHPSRWPSWQCAHHGATLRNHAVCLKAPWRGGQAHVVAPAQENS